MEIFIPLLKGASNGIYYGGKLRFVHSLVMTLLFRKLDLESIKMIFKFGFEHAYFLGKFVFTYKGLCLLFEKLLGKRLLNNFLAGLISGFIHNQ